MSLRSSGREVMLVDYLWTLSFKITVLFFLLSFCTIFAQTDTNKIKSSDNISVLLSNKEYGISIEKAPAFDSNYVRNYNNRLVVALFQSKRSYELNFEQKLFSIPGIDTLFNFNYVAQANDVTGLSVNYDKISFSVGLKSPVTESDIYKKGKTSYSNYNFSFTGSKYRLEASYRRYQGFYDSKTSSYDTTYTDSLPYYQNPSLFTRSFKVKGMYFMNKKYRFSYSSSFANTSRQLKTSGSFIVIGNIYNFLMEADNTIVPTLLHPYYGLWSEVNYFNLYGLSIGPGYTANLILWKKIFLNLTLTVGLEAQHRYYKNNSNTFSEKDWKVSIAAIDTRSAIGYNANNFFFSFTSMTDFNSYNLTTMRFQVKFISGAFNIGYRFPLKEYKPIKMMKENKIYKMF